MEILSHGEGNPSKRKEKKKVEFKPLLFYRFYFTE